MAHRKNIVEAILIGNVPKIKELLREFDEKEEDYTFIESYEEQNSARIAVSLVKEKKADIPMKGLMMTSSFMRAI